MVIDVNFMYYKELNEKIRDNLDKEKEFILNDVNGQRYICCGINKEIKVKINGTPGNDMAAYMNKASIEVNGNVQDAIGNTMGGGNIVVHGRAGDALGYAMRDGSIYIRDDVGYRCGIHMKEFKELKPVIVIGGCAGSFLGEYMAGGKIILLNRENNAKKSGSYCGTGLHGGAIYIRGEVDANYVSDKVKIEECTEDDYSDIAEYIDNFCNYFGEDKKKIYKEKFYKLLPISSRPYGNLYVGIQ